MTPLIECVPNFSEGRRTDVVTAIRDAIASTPGVAVLHHAADASHHRSVITFIGGPEAVIDGAFAGVRAARELIDLRQHEGVHPRMGAADVVPFVPLDGATMDDCVACARALGDRVGRELEIPVFLYERAATRSERRDLAHVRRGGFEALIEALGRDPDRAPDFGPARVHPTFGAVAIGARPLLVAYNVYLGPELNLETARRVAREIRESSGGRRGLKALGLVVDGQAQVSMNLVDLARTSLTNAWEAVRVAAASDGVEPTWSEIVGLVPEREILQAGVEHLKLRGFDATQLLERAVRDATVPAGGRGSSGQHCDVLDRVAAPTPTPGGGSAAAHCGAVAAALGRMVAELTSRKAAGRGARSRLSSPASRATELMGHLSELVARDAEAYGAVSTTHREKHSSHEDRRNAIDAALLMAARVPLDTARACTDVAELCADLAATGHRAAAADAAVGALLAEAACRGAVLDVRVNIGAMSDPHMHTAMLKEADTLARRAAAARERALGAAEPGAREP